MRNQTKDVKFAIYVFIAALCIISNITALVFQFLFYELPCPLCLLQRFGFLAIGYGCILSFKNHAKTEHNIIIIISIIFTMAVAIRQVLLHIAPHDPGYGSTFLGIHFYTWSVLLSVLLITSMDSLSVIDLSLHKTLLNIPYANHIPTICKITLIILVIINVISTYLECGFSMCPANPTQYLLLK